MSDQLDETNRRGTLRRSPRGKPQVECRLGTLGLGPNLAKRLLNVSQTGASLIVNKPIPTEAQVEIVLISVGATKPVRLLGDVVRCDPQESDEHLVCLRFEHAIDYGLWQKLT